MCPNCEKNNTKKIGKRRGLQRYKCNDCSTKFQSKRRPEKLQEIIFIPQGQATRKSIFINDKL
ncbi:transposase-like zinc-binding domain-containing protein [Sulfurimonas sp.]|uniref:transposase-like zinc-binding domain-containing protein n=1 Tax=Sulfurimonas sp. TaxID=2022749 RepID=UPI003A7F6208